MSKGTTVIACCIIGSALFASAPSWGQILSDEPVPPAPPSSAQPPPQRPTPPPAPPPPAATAPAAAQPAPPAAPPAPPAAPPPAAPPPAVAPTTPTPAATSELPPSSSPSPAQQESVAAPTPTIDHDRFVGHFGVGYMGLAQLPIANATGGAAVINAPVIGARYWLRRELGIDAGLGFALASGSIEGGGTSADKPSQLGFAVHGGVPFNLAYGSHYTFQVVPELNLGLTSATLKGTPDVSLSGFRFDIGARAGAEIHFGFINVPELALQASIGLYLHRESRSATPSGGQSSGESSTTFATSVQSDPWALFANNISALYYF